jgi:DNA-binding response OmpR family regulator
VHILVIEDEKKVAKALREGLEAEGYEITTVPDGEEGLQLASRTPFDLLILDLALPRRDGIDVLTVLRRRNVATPVFILTARDTVEERVLGLDVGGDDYLVKPFTFPELFARIRALLRRGRADPVLKLQHEDLRVNLATREVERGERSLELTGKEFEVLECLLRHRGRTVSREMLASSVWHVAARATPLNNVIDVTIARLRRKIDDPFDKKLLHTVRGMGFVLGAARE